MADKLRRQAGKKSLEWRLIGTHPTDHRPFVAYDKESDAVFLRIVVWDAMEGLLVVPTRNECHTVETFTHWCDLPEVWQIEGATIDGAGSDRNSSKGSQ